MAMVVAGHSSEGLTQEPLAEDSQAEEALVLGPITVEETLVADTVITDKDLERTQASTLGDIFRGNPTVSVSGGGQTGAQKFYVRGLEDTNLNVTIDGARQGGGFFRHQGNLSIGADMLKRVEVEAGSGNALAGPGALGGAVRFTTKDAEDLLLPGQTMGAMVKAGFYSNDLTRLVGTAVYGRPIDEVSFLVYGLKSWSGDYDAGGGDTVSNTAGEPFSGLIKLAVRPTDDQELKYTFDFRQDDAFRPTRPNFVMDPPDVNRDQQFGRRTHALNYTLNPADVPWLDLRASAYNNVGDLTMEEETGGGVYREAEWTGRGLDVRNRFDLDPAAITVGIDYSWDQSEGNNADGNHVSEIGRTLGLYVQGDLNLTDAWSVSGGLRYDRTTLLDVSNNWHDNSHVSPNVSTRYQVTPAVGVFASWSEAFRGPRPLHGFTLLSGQAENPDTDVDGEVSQTIEGGVDLKWHGWTGSVVGFHTHIEDTIIYGGKRGKPFDRENGDDLTLTGVNASLGYGRETWNVKVSYAHIDMDFGDEPLSASDFTYGAPYGDRFIVDLRYRIPEWDLDLGWTSTVAMKLDDVPSGSPSVPGYAVHDATITWAPSERYQVSLAALNLLDRQYLDQTSPYRYTSNGGGNSDLYERGRDIRLTATVRF